MPPLGMYQVEPGQVAYGLNLQTYNPAGPVFQSPTIYSVNRPQYQTLSTGPGPITQTLSQAPPGSIDAYESRSPVAAAEYGGGGGYGRGRLIESYIASAPSAPVESYMGPSMPETPSQPSYESGEQPTTRSAYQSMPSQRPSLGGNTFMSAEIDASRSPSAAAAVARGRIRGDNIVRGQFGL